MPPTQKPQDKLEDWQTWLADDLRDHMCRLLASREIQRSWNELLETTDWSPYSNGTFNEWVNNNYIDSLAVDIRAITDRSQDTRSLKLLLDDLEKSRSLLPQLSIDPTNLSSHNSQLNRNPYKGRRLRQPKSRSSQHKTPTVYPDNRRRTPSRRHPIRHIPPLASERLQRHLRTPHRHGHRTRPMGVPIHPTLDQPKASHTNRRAAQNRIPKTIRNMAALLSTTLRLISVRMVTHPPPQIIRPCKWC